MRSYIYSSLQMNLNHKICLTNYSIIFAGQWVENKNVKNYTSKKRLWYTFIESNALESYKYNTFLFK